jgi:protein arginine kinase activator
MDICPFSGQPCPHPKIAHATEITDQIVQLNMCKICYGQYLKKSIAPPEQLVAAFIESTFHNKPVPIVPAERCSCGATFQDIVKTGRIGCDACYDTFKQELKKIVLKCQQADKHQGKIPKNKSLNSSIQEQIQALKIKMARAVEVENYEVAGVLKNKIIELQQQLNNF